MGHKAPLLVGIVMIAALAAFVTLFRSSPGELSRAHAAVAGGSFIGECRKCHVGKETAPGCLSCHSEIAGQLASRSGFHHRLLDGKRVECARCHSEHNGKDFQLVNEVSWERRDPKLFKHDFTDFRLTGKHAALACADCHVKRAKPFALPRFASQRRTKTFLGLSQDCAACHKDPHAGGLAADCKSCHGQDSWRPTTPLFDHERFFSLKLGHQRLDCKACHLLPAAGGSQRALAKGFPFDKVKGARCADCHADPHKTRWGRNCESCHTNAAVPWSSADARMTRALHAATGFRLQPPHAKVSCASCHDPKLPYARRYTDSRTGRPRAERGCESCHRDPHSGQFAAAHPRCADCHAPTAFKPARFSLADHRSFPLLGAHAKTACDACHVKDAAGVRRFTAMRKSCADCHADAHFGQFRGAGGVTRCESCHQDPSAWRKLVFDHNAQSRFKLDSAHKDVSCRQCHPVVALPGRRQTVQYKPLRTRCEDCHEITPR